MKTETKTFLRLAARKPKSGSGTFFPEGTRKVLGASILLSEVPRLSFLPCLPQFNETLQWVRGGCWGHLEHTSTLGN